MASSIEDIEFLARSNHRVSALRTLREGPSDRRDLQAATGSSKTTIARLLNEFEDRNWVGRAGNDYELTRPGEFVADEFLRLVTRMETERTLRDVWRFFPTELSGCTMAKFVDAEFAFPDAHTRYQPLPGTVELIEGADSVRGFSKPGPKPGSYETELRNAAAGTEMELILSPTGITQMVEVVDKELLESAVNSPYLSVLEHDTIPTDTAFVLAADSLGLFCRDDEGVTKVGVFSDNPDTVAWGASIYEDVRSDARPVDLLARLNEGG